MNGISYIELVLENCEVIKIDGKYIGDFDISNVHIDISRMGCNYIGKVKSCDSFCIEIQRGANILNKPFGCDSRGIKIFERIAIYNDITSIEVHYDTEDEEGNALEIAEYDSIYIPYEDQNEGELGSPNINQSTYINDLGDLYIVIDKNNKVFDIFDEEEINDKEYLDFHFQMCDVQEWE